jgi:hypothetical protein
MGVHGAERSDASEAIRASLPLRVQALDEATIQACRKSIRDIGNDVLRDEVMDCADHKVYSQSRS